MKLKKIISIILASVLLCSIASLRLSTNAIVAHTQSDAVSWAKSKVGTFVDYDGAYGAQCVDLIYYYYKYLGVSPVGGNAIDYAWNSLPNGWQRIVYYSGFAAQPGDIAVFKYGTYGHVGIVISANSSSMTLVHNRNLNGNGTEYARSDSYSYTSMNFYCVIRPDFAKTSVSYTSIATNTYYIKNVATGTWLSVSEGKDVNMNVVNLWTNTGDAMKMVISKAPTGYKIRPYVCKSRLVNPNAVYVSHNNDINIYDDVNDSSQWWQFEKVGNYYVIHNVQNPSCVLDAPSGKTSIAYARTYTGANSQKWILECVSHSYNGGTVTTNATCQKTGIKTYTCTVCSATKTETISKTNHNYNSKEIPSTCVNEGYTKHQCTICGDVYTSDETPKIAHDYNETYKAATCTENGYYLYTCSFCGSSYDVSITKTGHSWDYGKITTNATCNSTGVYTYTCNVCGETKTATIEKTGHRYVSTVIAPTCYYDGYTKHTCSVCGDEYISDKQRSLAHDYVETKKEKTCTEDGYIRIDCSVCKDMHKTVFYHTGHEWDNGKVTKAPTTTQTGIYTYTCTACGETKTDVMPVVPEVQEPTTSEPDTDALPGDVDDDGQVTASDARIALRASVGLEALPSGRKAVADMDSDGEITASDARKILRIAVGLDKN